MYDITSTSSIHIDFGWVRVGDGRKMRINKALLDTGNTCISIPRKFE